MSINDINNAAAAMNQLKARYEGFLDDADDQISARQAVYDDLSSDLVGIVRTEMAKTYYVSPNGSDANDGLSSATPFATLGRVFDYAPNGSNIDVRIESSEAEPFVITACNAARRRVKLRPLVNGENSYLNWRGSVSIYGGSLNTEYNFIVDYDGGEYSGSMFVAGDAAISFGGFNNWNVHLTNTTNLNVVNSRYTYGGLVSIYMGRINLLDAAGDPYAGTTSIFSRETGAGLAAYELWQCSLGPNFVHAGTPVGSNSYIVG